jgi:predicted DNA-binding transcriptional regulator AlpA
VRSRRPLSREVVACHERVPVPITVRVPVAVQMTGISRTNLYALIRTKQIEIVKLGRSTLVLVESLRRYIESLRS